MNARNGAIAFSRTRAHLAAACAIAGTSAVNAAWVTWNCNLHIPANIDGLYINIETQVTGSSGSTVPGWDINPFGSTGLSFYGTYPGGTFVRTAPSGGPTALPFPCLISASSPYSNSTSSVFDAGSPSGWVLNQVNYFGFRFATQSGETRYGIGAMRMGSSPSQRTLLWIIWESVGGSCCGSNPPPQEYCAADLTRSWTVDGSDLGMLLAAWGPCSPLDGCPADLNDDGQVDGQDLGLLLARWGPCAE